MTCRERISLLIATWFIVALSTGFLVFLLARMEPNSTRWLGYTICVISASVTYIILSCALALLQTFSELIAVARH